jgi:carbon monoxide dehydrogenase subunit G
MEIRNTFAVASPPEAVFEALVDLERVGPCIPGATIGSAADDGSHPASIAVKLGPMRMTYAGSVRIVERDDAARRAVLSADVKEARGQGSARATMTMDVASAGASSSVASVTDVQMSGRAAQMGRGIIEDVAGRLVEQMAQNLSAQLASAGAETGSDAPVPPPAVPSTAAAETAAAPAPAADTPAAAGASPAPDAVPGSVGPRTAGRSAPPVARPVNGFGLLLKVLAGRLRRLFGTRRGEERS